VTERQYWLIKTEPYVFSWDQFVRDGRAVWDGVRNYRARANLRAMKSGDQALFYHSNEGKEIVGIAEVTREHYPDPTAQGADWSAVDFVPVKPLTRPVTLKEVKADPQFAEMPLVRLARLSVQPCSTEHFLRVLELSKPRL
jgi:predicted RNA-binding protein with PUA-like domain